MAACPRAQQPGMPLIGYLGSETPELFATRLRSVPLPLVARADDVIE